MRISRLSVIAILAASLAAQAQVTDKGGVAPGLIGSMDNSIATLLGAHPGSSDPFFDAFVFDVASPGVAGGTIDMTLLNSLGVAVSDQATIAGIFFIDGGGSVFAQDIDASDGFSLTSLLPAGTFGFAVAGIGGDGQGLYSGSLLSINPAVPEPASYALMLGGLALMAGLARRQRKNR